MAWYHEAGGLIRCTPSSSSASWAAVRVVRRFPPWDVYPGPRPALPITTIFYMTLVISAQLVSSASWLHVFGNVGYFFHPLARHLRPLRYWWYVFPLRPTHCSDVIHVRLGFRVLYGVLMVLLQKQACGGVQELVHLGIHLRSDRRPLVGSVLLGMHLVVLGLGEKICATNADILYQCY